MSVITGNTIHIDNFPMQFAKVTMTKAGDSIVQKFPFLYRGLGKETFISRHILVSGWINVDCFLGEEKIASEYTETPYISRLRYGHIINPLGTYDMDTIVSTAVEDNSSIFCIHSVTQRNLIPNSINNVVKDKIWRIPSGRPFRLKTGRCYFSNVDLTINDIVKPAYEPIACVYREADAIPAVDAAIAEFWVERIFISI